jgi:hypothetical protein
MAESTPSGELTTEPTKPASDKPKVSGGIQVSMLKKISFIADDKAI